MSGINLNKGDKIDLGKASPGLSDIEVGLGWTELGDISKSEKSGFLGFLSDLVSGNDGVSHEEIDCDASVLLLNEEGKIIKRDDLIFYGNLTSNCGSVVHAGDNLTGSTGNTDDEVISINLNGLESYVHRVLFVVNIYNAVQRNQHFGMVDKAYIRVSDKRNGKELIRFNLNDDYSNYYSVFVGEIIKENGNWSFEALGNGSNFPGLAEIRAHYM